MSGIRADKNSKINAEGAISINNKGDGFVAENGSEINAAGSVSEGNYGAGYRAANNSTINLDKKKNNKSAPRNFSRLFKFIGSILAAIIASWIIYIFGWN